MATSIKDIEGIGDVLAEKFAEAGIKTVEKLLEAGASPKGRKELAEKTGISEGRILSFTNMADLFRINGVASQFAELLHAAGVDTVKELRNRNAENLHAKLVEVNEEKKLVRQVPSLSQVEDFIKQAKDLPPVMTY
jgi:predicted flap endonuclease-1-like 5' DNA nuclease